MYLCSMYLGGIYMYPREMCVYVRNTCVFMCVGPAAMHQHTADLGREFPILSKCFAVLAVAVFMGHPLLTRGTGVLVT